MVSHRTFGKLRLAQFLPAAEIVELTHWEFMNALWVGEAVGFSEWLRLESAPNLLRSLALHFEAFPAKAAQEVLRAIDLPLRPGMPAKQLLATLGAPKKEERSNGRVTYEFVLAGPPRYTLSCTVLRKGGLSYLVVMRP